MELTFREKDTIRLLLIIEKNIYKNYKQLSFNEDDLDARVNLKELIEKESHLIASLKLNREKYNLVCEFIIRLYNKPIDVNLPTVINPLINGDEFLKSDNYHFYRLISKCYKYVISREERTLEIKDKIIDVEVALLYNILLKEIDKSDYLTDDYHTRLLRMYSYNTLIDNSSAEKKMLSYELKGESMIIDSVGRYIEVFTQLKCEKDKYDVNESTIINHRKDILEKTLALLTFHIKNNPKSYKETSRYYFLMSYIKVLIALSPINIRGEMYNYLEKYIIERQGELSEFLNILYVATLDIENNIVPSINRVVNVRKA